MAINYAQKFSSEIDQVYAGALKTAVLNSTADNVKFIGGKDVRIPTLTTPGYKEHSRAGGWNRQAVSNTFETKTMTHDRDVEFLVDVMDVDETNQVLSAANVTNNFLRTQSVPELDAFRLSKIYDEVITKGGKTADTTVLTTANVLDVFDTMNTALTDDGAPSEGRIMFATPTVMKLLRAATGLTRNFNVQNGGSTVDRRVTDLDNVQIIEVESSRMKTLYDFTNGYTPGVGAKQINMILMHRGAVVAPIKHSAIYLFQPGEHQAGDGYLYQNRMYTDLWVYANKLNGVRINTEA